MAGQQLWRVEGQEVDELIVAFCTGEDPVLDLELLPYDCQASYAHAEMLHAIGVLDDAEWTALSAALREVYALAEQQALTITPAQEDGHTLLEAELVARTEAGLKVHTARSRNDQVIQATRLWVRSELGTLLYAVAELSEAFAEKGKQWAAIPMPGFTHTRLAMPSSAGQLFFAYAESLVENLRLALATLVLSNEAALGSASGYGVPLPIDRERVARTLGCSGLTVNTIAVQHGRGALEAEVVLSCHRVLQTLARLSADLVLLSSEAYGFFKLPEALTTGSSIMPQKRNPDVFELVRALPARALGAYTEISGVLAGLGAGYHRDLQRTKAPMVRCLRETAQAVAIMARAARDLEVDEARCAGAFEASLMQTDAVYARVRGGEAFREAYQAVKKDSTEAKVSLDTIFDHRTHVGAPGTDQSERLAAKRESALAEVERILEGASRLRGALLQSET